MKITDTTSVFYFFQQLMQSLPTLEAGDFWGFLSKQGWFSSMVSSVIVPPPESFGTQEFWRLTNNQFWLMDVLDAASNNGKCLVSGELRRLFPKSLRSCRTQKPGKSFILACELFYWFRTAEKMELFSVIQAAQTQTALYVSLESGKSVEISRAIQDIWTQCGLWTEVAKRLNATIDELREWLKCYANLLQDGITSEILRPFLTGQAEKTGDGCWQHPSGLRLTEDAYCRLVFLSVEQNISERELIVATYENYKAGEMKQICEHLCLSATHFLVLVQYYRGSLTRNNLESINSFFDPPQPVDGCSGLDLLLALLEKADDYLFPTFSRIMNHDARALALSEEIEPVLRSVLRPLSDDDFFEYLLEHESILPLLPRTENGRTVPWSVFSQYAPGILRQVVSQEVLLEVALCFVWLFHARLTLDFSVSVPVKKRRARSAAVVVDVDIDGDLDAHSETQYSPRRRRKHSKYDILENPSLDLYLVEIGRTPLINRDEEVALAKRIQDGDIEALHKLVKANLRFVVSVAKCFQNQGLPLADLINEGNIGLIKAAKRFDWTRGFKFISYAVWWIRQTICQALAEGARTIRLPLNRIGTLHKINKTREKLLQDLGHPPSDKQVADELGMKEEDVAFTLMAGSGSLSLDNTLSTSGDSETTLLEVIPDTGPAPTQTVMDDSLHGEIMAALDQLSVRETRIIKLYFGIDQEKALTLEEIGAIENVTRERVRQIKEDAIRRLRRGKASKFLRAYFDDQDREGAR